MTATLNYLKLQDRPRPKTNQKYTIGFPIAIRACSQNSPDSRPHWEIATPFFFNESHTSTTDSLQTTGSALDESMFAFCFVWGSHFWHVFPLQGDSGGPLVCRREHGSWTLIGVTSWGMGCARGWIQNPRKKYSRRGSPGLFTDLVKVLPWIQEHMDTGSNKIPQV